MDHDRTPGAERQEWEERLAASLSRALPGFRALRSAKRLSGGASQQTWRVEVESASGQRTLAVRIRIAGASDPEGEGPDPGAEAALFRIARAAGVPEPEILHVFAPEEALGEGFVMEWLAGETLGARILKDTELDEIRPRLAFQCGEILARIHGIDIAKNGLDGMLKVLTPRETVNAVWERYRAFDTPLPMIDYTARWLQDHLPEQSEAALVHGDFRNGNLVVTPDGIVAVLDWEIAHIGDPARDLGWLCTNSWRFGRFDLPVGGFGRLEDLLAGYRSVSGVRIDRRRVHFWQVFGSFWWAIASLGMAETWRSGSDRSVERPGIARRSSECQVDCANLVIPGPVQLAQPAPPPSSVDMPRSDELLTSVRDFLRIELRGALEGRAAFLALVASNSLDIVQRELTLGPARRRMEHESLKALLGSDAPLEVLRARLCEGIRSGAVPLDQPGLAQHLRNTAANQLAIDQPGYSGLRVAMAAGGAGSAEETQRIPPHTEKEPT